MDTLPQVLGQSQKVFPLRTGTALLLRHGQLSVLVDEGLLPLKFLHAEHHHVPGSVPGDIDRLPGLSAKIRNLIGIVAQV